jgi:HD-like signal output (HDOD) protein
VEYLQRRLDGSGLAVQPEVAVRILNLVCDQEAGLREFADAIRTDATLTGRLLRLANSAFFAQRQPVSSIDRACVLLGLDRLKAVSCGFYLSRAANVGAATALSRRVWGESLLRACLASELARAASPGLVAEAFVVGLMVDAGVPLLARWIGPAAEEILAGGATGAGPGEQFRMEFEALPYTHVDVVTAMLQCWKLPDLIARPIERHHSEPGSRARGEPVHQLHRLAYCVGALRLDASGEQPAPAMGEADGMLLSVERAALAEAVQRAVREFTGMREMFRDLAALTGDVGAIADRAQQQLITLMDETMVAQLRRESRGAPACFSISGHRVEIEIVEDGQAVAYLNDTRGRRLLSHAFRPGEQDARGVLDALGIEHRVEDLSRDLEMYLRSLAA